MASPSCSLLFSVELVPQPSCS